MSHLNHMLEVVEVKIKFQMLESHSFHQDPYLNRISSKPCQCCRSQLLQEGRDG